VPVQKVCKVCNGTGGPSREHPWAIALQEFSASLATLKFCRRGFLAHEPANLILGAHSRAAARTVTSNSHPRTRKPRQRRNAPADFRKFRNAATPTKSYKIANSSEGNGAKSPSPREENRKGETQCDA
jgi:hypothetical protein